MQETAWSETVCDTGTNLKLWNSQLLNNAGERLINFKIDLMWLFVTLINRATSPPVSERKRTSAKCLHQRTHLNHHLCSLFEKLHDEVNGDHLCGEVSGDCRISERRWIQNISQIFYRRERRRHWVHNNNMKTGRSLHLFLIYRFKTWFVFVLLMLDRLQRQLQEADRRLCLSWRSEVKPFP